jgi:ABC-2 type transport system permease protein
MTGTVAAPQAIAVSYRVVLRQLVTTGRVVALGLIGVAVAVVGWAVGRSNEPSELIRLDNAVGVISLVAFTILVPVVSLVFAAASLGDTREDGTLVYLWLRPMRRWTVVVGAWLAAVTVSLPLTVIPSAVTAALLDVGSDLIVATVIASTLGVLAYSALFVLLGLLVKNAIVWGLGYIIIWEGVVAAFGSSAAKVAVRGYTSSILTARTGVQLELGDLSQTAGIVVPVLVALGALALASIRLDRLEVA